MPEHNTESRTRKEDATFIAAFRKVWPFWLAALIVSGAGIILLHFKSISLIDYIQYPEANPIQLAESYRVEAQKAYEEAAIKFAELKGDPDRADKMKVLPELGKSRKIFLQCLALKPNMNGIYEYLADLASFENDKAAMYYYQGMRAAAEKQPAASLEAFDRALKEKENYHPALIEKSRALIATGKIEEAGKTLDVLLQSGKPDAETLFIKAELALRRNDSKEYLNALEEAVRIDPGYLPASKTLSEILMNEKQFDKSAEILLKARETNPRDANLLHRLGIVYYQKGDMPKAEKALQSALELETHSAPLYFDLARVYEKMGKKSHSTAMLQKAVEIDPSFKNKILFPEGK